MPQKYNNDISNVESWDFMEGYKEAILMNERPASDAVPAEIILNGRLPFVVLVPEVNTGIGKDKEALTFVIQTREHVGEVSFQKHVVQENQSPLNIAIEDLYGEFSFSTFSMRIISGEPKEKTLDIFIMDGKKFCNEKIYDLAVTLLKKFITSYRAACELEGLKYDENIRRLFNKDWIPEIDVKRLSPWFDTRVYSKNGKLLYEQNHLDYRGTGLGLGTDLKEDTLSILQKYCLVEIIPDIRNYMQIARRHYLRQDFEAYCIMLVSVMEKKIFKILRDKLSAKGLNESEIEDRIHVNQVRKDGFRKKTISIWKAVNIICNGNSYTETPEYLSVISNLYEVRDEIIHGDVVLLNKKQADAMGKAYVDFTKHLIDKP